MGEHLICKLSARRVGHVTHGWVGELRSVSPSIKAEVPLMAEISQIAICRCLRLSLAAFWLSG